MLLVNGKIHTMDGRVFEALAISGNRIAHLGTTAEIDASGADFANRIDLQGKSVFPGFIDSHMHFVEFGLCARMVNLEEAASIEDVIERIRDYISENNTKDGWILGYGWNENRFSVHEMPTKDDLDKASKNLPIMITRVCEHIISVNSKALDLTGANKHTAVKGGVFDLGGDGELNGIIRENALDWFNERLPARTVDEIKEAICAAAGEALRYGITTVHTSDLHSCSFDVMYAAYMQLMEESRLPLRICQQLYMPDLEQLEEYLSRGLKPFEGDDFFKLGPVKLLTDGCLGARTAALRQDYSDDPGKRGMDIYEQVELEALVLKAQEAGMQLFIHAIGDAALENSLNAIENALKKSPASHRHIINHFQIGAPDLFGKAARIGVLATIQPGFVSSDWEMAEGKIGPERLKHSYAWKSIADHGILLRGSSDCPVESCNPFHGIYAAVTRKDLDGNPLDGLTPYEKLDLRHAIHMYTTNGAYGSFEESKKGLLAEGYLADMVVLSQDPFDTPEAALKDIRVLMTIVDGEIRYIENKYQ